MFVLISSFL